MVDLAPASCFHADMNCVFCGIINKEIPSTTFFEDEDVIVFKDRAPLMPIHLLICPRAHYEDFLRTPPEIHAKLAETVQKVSQMLGDKGKDFRVMVNNGPKSGQTVFHIHYHFLARG